MFQKHKTDKSKSKMKRQQYRKVEENNKGLKDFYNNSKGKDKLTK